MLQEKIYITKSCFKGEIVIQKFKDLFFTIFKLNFCKILIKLIQNHRNVRNIFILLFEFCCYINTNETNKLEFFFLDFTERENCIHISDGVMHSFLWIRKLFTNELNPLHHLCSQSFMRWLLVVVSVLIEFLPVSHFTVDKE